MMIVPRPVVAAPAAFEAQGWVLRTAVSAADRGLHPCRR